MSGVKKVIGTKNKASAMVNLCYFAANFPYKFIEKCWDDNQHLAEHLRSKLESATNDKPYTSTGDIINFVLNLDRENQLKLMEWIDSNYKAFDSL